MRIAYSIAVCLLLGLLFYGVRAVIRRSRRKHLLTQRLTEEERKELVREFVLFGCLPIAIRDKLEGLMHIFMAEKSFEACGGVDEVTLHMRQVIAAQACILLVNRKHDYYRKLRSILVYPSAYKVRDEHGEESVRLGESWTSGSVILAWSSVKSGGRDDGDGHNVTIHEFAHQLDQLDGAGDGLPELHGRRAYREWAHVFSVSFAKFQKKLEKRKRTVIDAYGGANPAEFFAVATETFYEKPEKLKKEYPEVYEQLKQYYQVDPVTWL